MRLRAHPADDTASKTKRRGRQLQAAARQQREPQESEPQVRFPYFQKTKKPLDSDFSFGAGDGNRTHTTSLEGWDSTIELHPRCNVHYYT